MIETKCPSGAILLSIVAYGYPILLSSEKRKLAITYLALNISETNIDCNSELSMVLS